MNIRINDIECRQTTYKPKEYEFVKWEKNMYYGTEKELLDEGYERIEYDSGGWAMTRSNHTIDSSCFKNPETCYVIAWLEPNRREPDVNLLSVGSRLLDLSEEDMDAFFRVYKIANEMIMDMMKMESL
jgi:hypothetical protein